tara:strand:+ start:530 stop:868 length:339 start_codon:yes stop_codon:yes gene_type:complete
MFKLKIIIPTIIFLILLIITSIIKNQTRIIEKKLYKLNKIITLKEKDINESQLDYYFLSSPAEIEKKIKLLGLNSYSSIDHSRIFLNLSNFISIQKKITVFNNQDETKTKKN